MHSRYAFEEDEGDEDDVWFAELLFVPLFTS